MNRVLIQGVAGVDGLYSFYNHYLQDSSSIIWFDGLYVDDRCSNSDVAIYLGRNLISWWPKKQKVIARSSIEI